MYGEQWLLTVIFIIAVEINPLLPGFEGLDAHVDVDGVIHSAATIFKVLHVCI